MCLSMTMDDDDPEDAWAGAVAACGGVDKMPTGAQLGELADYLYNTSGIGDSDKSGLTLDTDKASALGFDLSLNYFYVWSSVEATFSISQWDAYARGFYMNGTHWYRRNGRYETEPYQAVCLGDDLANYDSLYDCLTGEQATLCEQVEENFNIKSSACDTEIDTIVTAAASESFADATPHIVFANGLKMYIASELEEIADLADSDDDDDTTGYLIYMDVNGDSGKGVLFQDVFPFYLLKSGKVVPLYNADKDAGAATSAHLSVNAYYDTYSNGTRTVNLLLAGSDFMTAACSVGYVTSETYCGSIAKSSYCSDKTADCRYKVYKPFRLF